MKPTTTELPTVLARHPLPWSIRYYRNGPGDTGWMVEDAKGAEVDLDAKGAFVLAAIVALVNEGITEQSSDG